MTISKARLEQEKQQSFEEGKFAGARKMREEMTEDLRAATARNQLEIMRAVTAMLQESSKVLSRAGYLIGKATGKEGF